MTQGEFIDKYLADIKTFQDDNEMDALRDKMLADLAALLAAEREKVLHSLFVWRDGEPYYLTALDMPMAMPRRILKKIAAIRSGKV